MPVWKTIGVALTAAVLALTVTACPGEPEGELGQPCYFDQTCNAPYVCQLGICVQPSEQQGGLGEPCYPNDTCDSSYLCEGGICVEPGIEQGGLGEPCYPNDTCDNPYVCDDGVCVEPPCAPVCGGRECGDDGCGGECPPGCEDGWSCDVTGLCIEDPFEPTCVDGGCLVPAGPFMMGCNEAVDDECRDSEKPYREVNVPAFEIDQNQVTWSEYQYCVNGGGCTAPSSYCDENDPDRPNHPVSCVSWDQAEAFCAWVGRRLCTEAEWEKAARGTDGRKYPWGNDPISCDLAVYNEQGGSAGWGCGTGTTAPVGSRPAGASPYGALDMVGNLWDWVEDDWHGSLEGAPTDGSAWVDEPRNPYERTARGGGFFNGAAHIRASVRSGHETHLDDGTHGIRCCRSL